MSNSRVKTRHDESLGYGYEIAQLGRLTPQYKKPILLAACGGHLVHHPARRADHQIFNLLTEQRDFSRVHLLAQCGENGKHYRHLECSGGANALAFGYT